MTKHCRVRTSFGFCLYSLVYNKEEDEVYAGGIGFVDEWKVQGAEVRTSRIGWR
ncbi:hypothetical protein DPMN_184158 [Dreissena polymorpha]|uniref:Uncharacterized protein n=1 Tax=Dreissena polymorpha TaxID=45954 RepID=A0A9D4DHC2_DREPO|nr:hypothetical protein DPMN_184158 [Dreissena polymorpha]